MVYKIDKYMQKQTAALNSWLQ